jgi:hypothetical protein
VVAQISIVDELRASACDFAQSALQAHLADQQAVFLLHAATSLEHLAKAHLASVHPSLIAANDFNSLLQLCDHPAHSRTPRTLLRTIGAQDALTRVGQLVPPIENLKSSLQLLISVRNGVVHAGQRAPQVDVLIPFLRACDHLLAETSSARHEFWGESLEIVDARLSDSADAATVSAADAIASAKRRFADRYSELDSGLQTAMIATVEDTYAPEKYEQTLWTCPACEHRALVYGSFDVSWEPDWDYSDGEAWVAGVYPVVRFAPGTLDCRVCGLELDGEAELRAAGVPAEWQLEDDEVNPSDFYESEYD